MKDLNEELQKQQQAELTIEETKEEQKDKFFEEQQFEEDKLLETGMPELTIAEGFQEVKMEEGFGELVGEVPKTAELIGMEKKQEVKQDADPVAVPTEVLKEALEKKHDKPQALPPELSSIMQKIESWSGKLSPESSMPVVKAIKSIGTAANDEDMGAQLAELTKAALNYLKKRSGFRFTG